MSLTQMEGRAPQAAEGWRLPSQGLDLPLQISHYRSTATTTLPSDRTARDRMVHSLDLSSNLSSTSN